MVFVDRFIYFLHFCIYLSLKNKKKIPNDETHLEMMKLMFFIYFPP